MLHAEATQRRALPAGIVFRDEPGHPGKLIARLSVERLTEFVLMTDTLAELRALLPSGRAG